MKKITTALLMIGLGLLLPKTTHASALFVQEIAFSNQMPEVTANIHRFGVGVAVINPSKTPGLSREVQIRDLGPELKDLIDDRVPATAWAWVNHHPPLAFQQADPSTLKLQIPQNWLNAFSKNEVHVTAWDYQGNAILQASLDGMFF
ncbi:MAG: hypothetical protein QGH51_03350 [Planctomycetota bacterium]|nr:hypothetical protein [Planctomycetota bacterium]MDP6941042.1 hypothetical protein [Planctomycetota bacterium]